MKRVLLAAAVTVALAACQSQPAHKAQSAPAAAAAPAPAARQNPLLVDSTLPFAAPRFDQIQDADYGPALDEGIRIQAAEIQAIANDPAAPTFANTIEAMERSGQLLGRVAALFFNNAQANSSETLQKTAADAAPKLSAHQDSIVLNDKLWQRVHALYQQRDALGLDAEQKRVLERYHVQFVRAGADLPPAKKEELKKLNERMATLQNDFGDKLLAETRAFLLVIDNKDDLAGLPESVVSQAAATAKARGHEGKWVFTLQAPSIWPFMQFSSKRELRKQLLTAYTTRGNHGNENDTNALVLELAKLRAERAALQGYKNFAAYTLEDNVAKTPAAALKMLNDVFGASMKVATRERDEMKKLAAKDGIKDFGAYDWWYYAEKVRQQKYDIDESSVRPYFALENVKRGLFDVVGKQYGLTFTRRPDLPGYAAGVEAWEVKERDGSNVGVVYFDHVARANKQQGAWMNAFRDQQRLIGDIRPIVVNVCNFPPPGDDGTPSLLTYDEAKTMFHEFGHALHGLLSNVKYPLVAGANTPRDWVEFPSQFEENWMADRNVLKSFAKHYKTGEPIPDALIDKLVAARKFNQGFAVGEAQAAALLDMAWHTLGPNEIPKDAQAFEAATLKKIGLIPEIHPRYHTTYFAHVWGGGYAAGYYGYLWTAALAADAFGAYKEKGDIFDPDTNTRFRQTILSRGMSADPLAMFVAFRGREPNADAYMKKMGLK